MKRTTIAAIATPRGSGGIGIIRISGPEALGIARTIFRKSGARQHTGAVPDSGLPAQRRVENRTIYESHRLYHGHIVNPVRNGVIDEVLLTYMKAPWTYTREDVVEIQAHAGAVVLRAILETVLAQGARLAEPGEFTKRAFLNGRIDLTQAEAVVDIINAKTSKSLEMATSQIAGELRRIIERNRDALVNLLTEIEAVIDFPEDVEDAFDLQQASRVLRDRVGASLRELINQYDTAHIFRDGVRVVMAGRPNVGKSSLMNRMTRKSRSIVTSIPGTTRDVIEETVNVGGIPVVLTDTAGLQDTQDPVETIGIQKAEDQLSTSDLVLFMIDASVPVDEQDFKIYDKIRGKRTILVINKSDLVDEGFMPEVPEAWREIPRVVVSALCNSGIDELEKIVEEVLTGSNSPSGENTIVPNLRQRVCLDRSLRAVSSACEGIGMKTHFELIAIDIQEGVDALNEILGITARQDVLDEIFNKFCIGK